MGRFKYEISASVLAIAPVAPVNAIEIRLDTSVEGAIIYMRVCNREITLTAILEVSMASTGRRESCSVLSRFHPFLQEERSRGCNSHDEYSMATSVF